MLLPRCSHAAPTVLSHAVLIHNENVPRVGYNKRKVRTHLPHQPCVHNIETHGFSPRLRGESITTDLIWFLVDLALRQKKNRNKNTQVRAISGCASPSLGTHQNALVIELPKHARNRKWPHGQTGNLTQVKFPLDNLMWE